MNLADQTNLPKGRLVQAADKAIEYETRTPYFNPAAIKIAKIAYSAKDTHLFSRNKPLLEDPDAASLSKDVVTVHLSARFILWEKTLVVACQNGKQDIIEQIVDHQFFKDAIDSPSIPQERLYRKNCLANREMIALREKGHYNRALQLRAKEALKAAVKAGCLNNQADCVRWICSRYDLDWEISELEALLENPLVSDACKRAIYKIEEPQESKKK